MIPRTGVEEYFVAFEILWGAYILNGGFSFTRSARLAVSQHYYVACSHTPPPVKTEQCKDGCILQLRGCKPCRAEVINQYLPQKRFTNALTSTLLYINHLASFTKANCC